MLKYNKKKISLLIGISLLSIGCGSSSTSPTNTNDSTDTSTISGTVPGTLIEAFCKDGTYYKTNSNDNGTSEHPFSLEVPKGLDCKLVMTTNENDANISNRIITPIQFSNTSSSSTYFALNADTDLGNIPLEMNSTGVQPLFNLSVADTALDVRVLSYDPLDVDGDGIPNVYEDDDGDGKYNKDDEDDDGDGIPDTQDSDNKDDIDGDGIPNISDLDDDGDGIHDSIDTDKDNDGIPDSSDNDDDNDGIPDSSDDDDDNDGVEDSVASNITTITSTTTTLPTTYTLNEGRLLGANCAQCHGTNGISTNSWDSIAGEGNLLDEFREEDENALMYSVSHGFSDTQVNLIGSWLSGTTYTSNTSTSDTDSENNENELEDDANEGEDDEK